MNPLGKLTIKIAIHIGMAPTDRRQCKYCTLHTIIGITEDDARAYMEAFRDRNSQQTSEVLATWEPEANYI
jgi:hypothetical protein